MSTKPVWLLDIDGVINAMGPGHHRYYPKSEWIFGTVTDAKGRTFEFKVPIPVRDLIIEVHNKDLAEIRWHTTWQHEAKAVAEFAGLPDFPVHPAPEATSWVYRNGEGPGGWWKLPGVRRLVEETQGPYLWTDDDITYYVRRDDPLLASAHHFPGSVVDDELDASVFTRPSKPNLIIDPDPRFGLTPDHCRIIRAWLDVQVIARQQAADV